VGDQVKAFGQNLAAPAANPAYIKQATTVTVGGANATLSDVAADHSDVATLVGALTIVSAAQRIDVLAILYSTSEIMPATGDDITRPGR
jgi:hypothetical protein